MEIEFITHHRDAMKNQIATVIAMHGATVSDDVLEEFLMFYDYNGSEATIENVYSWCRKRYTTNQKYDAQYSIALSL